MGSMIDSLISTATPILAGIVVVLAFGIMFTQFYRRASPERAFVRTGLKGAKAFISGGGLVLPIIHEIRYVNLRTLKLLVDRRGGDAMITNDNRRADVQAEFYVRVSPTDDAVRTAARTLGERTLEPERLKELIEGKFIDGLRSVAATMSLQQLHEKRTDFVKEVQNTVAADLEQNGLELESVSLTYLDQTDITFLDPNNTFDAKGLTLLTKETEEKKRERNQIEEMTRVDIASRKADADKQEFTINQDRAEAEAAAKAQIARKQSEADATEAEAKAEAERRSQEASVMANRKIKAAEIASQQEIEAAEIAKKREIDIAEQEAQITLAEKSKAVSQAEAEAQIARAEQVKAEEAVITERQRAEATRVKEIAVIKATEEAEVQATGVRVSAQAEKDASVDLADAIRIETDAKAGQIERLGQAEKSRLLSEAEGREAQIRAENQLSSQIIEYRLREETIRVLPVIMAEAVKPAEKISNISIVDMNGLGVGGSGGEAVAAGGGLPDQVLGAVLRHRAFAPFVDHMLKESGLSVVGPDGSPLGLQEFLEKSATAVAEKPGDAPVPAMQPAALDTSGTAEAAPE
ncbi:flotillin family protein [Nisaea sediminum]|uniref:flotillin family protein n=1 Tax=Nisaea sediminum TaxID=2775867 RepID=UPI0018675AAE|nr:flotillin domain-containing protein [Nisaea sediminum]